MGTHPATDVVWRTLFDLLKWPLDGDMATWNADTRAVNAVLGGTMWAGVCSSLFAMPQQFAAIPVLPRFIHYALYAWFWLTASVRWLHGYQGIWC